MKKELLALIQPSLVGGTISLVFAVLGTLVLVVAAIYSSPALGFNQYHQALESGQVKSNLYDQLSAADTAVNSSDFAGDAAIFTIWAIVGLSLYTIILSIVYFSKDIAEFVGNRKKRAEKGMKEAARSALLRAAVRGGAIIGFFVVYKLFMSYALPLLIFLSSSIVKSPPLIVAAAMAGIVIIFFITIHALIIITRALLLRRRVFFGHYFVAE